MHHCQHVHCVLSSCFVDEDFKKKLAQPHPLVFGYQGHRMVPDKYLASGYPQVTLQQLHERDWDRYLTFMYNATLNNSIDEFVSRVNVIANAQEVRPLGLGAASVYSNLSVLDALDMSMNAIIEESKNNAKCDSHKSLNGELSPISFDPYSSIIKSVRHERESGAPLDDVNSPSEKLEKQSSQQSPK